jgi:hypothetical protein
VRGDVEDLEIRTRRAYLTDHLVAAELGHVQIRNQQIERLAVVEDRDAFDASGRFDHTVPGFLENAPLHLPNRRLVIDNEDER